jgi:hypothetical protein
VPRTRQYQQPSVGKLGEDEPAQRWRHEGIALAPDQQGGSAHRREVVANVVGEETAGGA